MSSKLFAKFGHQCFMPDEDDLLEKKYPGESWQARCKRRCVNLFLVSEHMCQSLSSHLKSHGAVLDERERQLDHENNVIHPFSPFRFYWDVVMIVVSYVQLVITPIDAMLYILPIMFPFVSSYMFKSIRMTFDLVCVLDLILNFATGYYDEARKEVVFEYKTICKHYLRTAFIFDVVASLPTHVDLLFDLEVDGWTMHILQGVSLLKICRYYILEQLFNKICNVRKVDYYVRQAIFITVSVGMFWLIATCVHFFTINMSGFARRRFYAADKKEEVHYFFKTPLNFIAFHLYNGALLINGVSAGLYPVDRDKVLSPLNRIFYWSMSRILLIYILAKVIEYMNVRTAASRKYKHMIQLLTEFMRHKELPLPTQRKIIQYYEYHYQKSYYNEKEIMATISGQLRQEISMHNCRQLVENVKFFKGLPLTVLVRIVSFLHSETYMANDVICRSNTVGDCMYFISSGTVAVYSASGKEICHLYDGDYFGEIALVTDDSMRVANVLAVEMCELYRLERKDFIKAVHPYPDLLEVIRRIAAERREDALEIDVKFRRQRSAPC